MIPLLGTIFTNISCSYKSLANPWRNLLAIFALCLCACASADSSLKGAVGDDFDVIITTYFDTDSRVDADFEFPSDEFNYLIAELYNFDEGLIIPEQVKAQGCCAETVTFTGLQQEDNYMIKLIFIRVPDGFSDGFERDFGRNEPPLVLLSEAFIAASD